ATGWARVPGGHACLRGRGGRRSPAGWLRRATGGAVSGAGASPADREGTAVARALPGGLGRCASCHRVAGFREAAGKAEAGQHAVVDETVYRGDVVAIDGEHDEPARVVDAGRGIPQVAAEGGLPVRPGGDQAVARRAAGERDDREEVPSR